MSLYAKLNKIAEQVESQRRLMNNEDATILVSVQPFIRALGYNTENLIEVQPQYSADAKTGGGERVDYAIMREGKPVIFVEAKAANLTLNDNYWKQLHHYFNAEDVRIGILTNGIEYRFYTDLKKPNVMDKQSFLTIDLLNLDKRKVEVLEGFTKTRFDPMNTIRYLKLREKVEKELNQPSDWLVKHFIWGIHVGPRWKSVIEAYRPLLKRAIDEYVDKAIEQKSVQLEGSFDETARPVADEETEPTPLAPSDPDYIPVFGYYNGHRFEAELRLESVRKGIFIGSKSIKYKGDLMKSSHAMWVAIRDVFPEFDSDTWNSKNMNSWTFWHVVDPLDGSERILRLIAGWKKNRDEALYMRILNS